MGAGVGRPDLVELVEMSHVIKSSEGRLLARQAPSSVLLRDQNVALKSMALLADFEGPLVGVSTACSASAHAIGEAFRHIQEGDAKLMLAGGYDALTTWFDVIGFGLLGALTKDHADEPARASRPFDAERSGFVVGEGAVVAVLEELRVRDRPRRHDLRRADRLWLEHERLPDDRPPAGRRRRHPVDAAHGRRRGHRPEGGRLRRRARHEHSRQRRHRDARDQAGLRRPRVRARGQLAEVDDRAPDLRRRGAERARRRVRDPRRSRAADDQPREPRPEAATSTTSRTRHAGRRCGRLSSTRSPSAARTRA